MKKETSLSAIKAAAIATMVVLAFGASSQAATLYWDSNGAVAGAGATPTGNWGTSTFWSADPAGGAATGAYVNGSDVVFSAGTDAVNNYTVTMSSSPTMNSLTFANPGGILFDQNGSRTFTIGSGGITVNSTVLNTITLGQATNSLGVTLGASQSWNNNSASLLTVRNGVVSSSGVSATLTFAGSGAGNVQFSNTINDGAAGGVVSLVVNQGTGAGSVLVTGGNFSGGTTIKSGTLQASGSFGTGTVLLGDTGGVANATLTGNTAGTITNNITVQAGSSGNTLTIGNTGTTGAPTFSGSITLNNAVTFNAGTSGTITLTGGLSGSGNITTTASGVGYLAFNRGSFTLANNISGSGGLMQSGAGTLTLTGATGGTTTYAGTTRAANGGTIQLDFNAAGAPSSNILTATSALSLGTGTLSVKGKNTGTSTQTLGNLTLTASTANSIALNNNGGAGTTLTLGNTWTRNAGSILAIDLSAGGTVASNPTAAASNNVLGFATVKDATATGFALLSGGNVVRLSGQGALLTTGNVATTNYLQTAAGATLTLSGSQSVNSLEINTGANSGTLDLGAGTLTITSKALLMSGANDYTIQNGQLGASATEVIIQQLGAGKLIVTGAVGGGAGTLTINGPGTVQIGAGGTSGNIGGTGGVVTGGNILFNRSDAMTVANTFTSQTSAAAITQAGAGVLTLTGGNTNFLGTFNLNANTTTQAGSTSALGIGTLVFNNGAKLSSNSATAYGLNNTAVTINGNITLGDATNTGTLTLSGGVDLAGANRTVTVASGNSQTFSGAIGNGGLTLAGTGTLTLSGTNTFAGGVTIKSGTVATQSATALGTGAVTLGDTTGSATATLLSNNTSNALRTFTNDINVVSGSSGTKTLASAGTAGNNATTYAGNITLADNLAIGGSTGAGVLTLSGSITGNGFTVTNTGVTATAVSGVIGTGVTVVHDSASSLAISGTSSNIFTVLYKQGTGSVGVGAMDNATLAINAGAAVTFGHSALSIGGFNDGASGGGSFADNTSGTARAVTLAGSGTYSFSGTFGVASVLNMNLTKGGTGSQTLSGASVYTGATTVSGGTLIAGADALVSTAGAFGNAATAITLGDAATTTNNSNATLLTGGAFTIARAVTVANQATTGTYKIGGNTNNSSTFSGLITTNKDLTISQAATTGGNALNITGGITGASAAAKTLTFAGPGAINVSTTGITTGVGTVAVNVAGGTTTFSASNTYTGATTVTAGTLIVSGAGTINTSSGVSITGGILDYQNNSTALNRNVTLNGGTFKNNSTQAYAGSLTFTSGTVGGTNLSGVALSIGANQTISPGNSPGTMVTGSQTWLDNGNYNWQLLDASGSAGTGYDTVAITGGLNLTGLTGSPDFNINLWTLSSIAPDVNGNASNFINGNNYTWKLVSTTTGITGFNAANFTINTAAANGTSGFSNAFTGSFSVSVSGNDLNLLYTAVPEPSTWALLAFSLTTVLVLRRRRKA